jgi:hypothetical protein
MFNIGHLRKILDRVCSVFVTPESRSELTCRTSNRMIDFSHAEGS